MPKFDTYYNKYLTPKIIRLVEQTFDVSEIRQEHDPHFSRWETKIWRSKIADQLDGDLTYAEKELIVKHALRQIAGYDRD